MKHTVVPVHPSVTPEGERGTASRDRLHEPREAQFEVQRRCPHAADNDLYPAHFATLLPFAVWVNYPPEDLFDVAFPCQQTQVVYRATRKGRKQLSRLFGGANVEPQACFCEHMGRLIE